MNLVVAPGPSSQPASLPLPHGKSHMPSHVSHAALHGAGPGLLHPPGPRHPTVTGTHHLPAPLFVPQPVFLPPAPGLPSRSSVPSGCLPPPTSPDTGGAVPVDARAGEGRMTGAPDVSSGVDSAGSDDDLQATFGENPSMNFDIMLDYITQCFPEAKGIPSQVSRPDPPGENRPPDSDRRVRLTRAKPIQFSLDKADKALRQANESSRPALARYPDARYRKVYTVSGHDFGNRPAKLNPDLALALITKGREPSVVVQAPELCRLEGAIARSLEAQNFNFWCLGAFYRLFPLAAASSYTAPWRIKCSKACLEL